MTSPVTVEVAGLTPASVLGVAALRYHPLLNVRVASRKSASPLPRGRTLRVEPASRIEPMVTLLWGGHAPSEDEAQRAARVGLSSAVFGSGPRGYEWSRAGRPLTGVPRVGLPDPKRPWVLVAPHARMEHAAVVAATGLTDPQLHYLGAPDTLDAGSVWWFPTPSTLLSLMGRVHAVVASQGPLAWDAIRLGVPVVEPHPVSALPAVSVERRLACTVPARLATSREFWDRIGRQLAEGIERDDWGTLAWTLRARRERAHNAGPLAKVAWHRKLLKLKRDPAAFWADSKILTRFARDQRTQR